MYFLTESQTEILLSLLFFCVYDTDDGVCWYLTLMTLFTVPRCEEAVFQTDSCICLPCDRLPGKVYTGCILLVGLTSVSKNINMIQYTVCSVKWGHYISLNVIRFSVNSIPGLKNRVQFQSNIISLRANCNSTLDTCKRNAMYCLSWDGSQAKVQLRKTLVYYGLPDCLLCSLILFF